MQSYFAFLVPAGLAVFAIIVGVVSIIVERHRAARRVAQSAAQRSFKYGAEGNPPSRQAS